MFYSAVALGEAAECIPLKRLAARDRIPNAVDASKTKLAAVSTVQQAKRRAIVEVLIRAAQNGSSVQ